MYFNLSLKSHISLAIIIMVFSGKFNNQHLSLAGRPLETKSVHTAASSIIDMPVKEKIELAIPAATEKSVHPDSVVSFARTLIGIPYRYGSINPAKGFDCSGFITYVFTHFNISVPRSSINFTNYGKEVTVEKSMPGDLILFTGTNIKIRKVGHMGMVESKKNDTLYFIHSSSGKANGVVISPLGKYYKSRFVKVIRVFEDELF